jgi:hypothetical protein
MSVRDPGHESNVALLREVVVKLGALADSLVFVGGCATGLLVTAVRAQAVRVTVDVDTVAGIETIGDYHTIERRLEQQGFARLRSRRRNRTRCPMRARSGSSRRPYSSRPSSRRSATGVGVTSSQAMTSRTSSRRSMVVLN